MQIYQTEMWCDSCADKIRKRILDDHAVGPNPCNIVDEGLVALPGRGYFFDPDDEQDYDSGDFPKHCSGSSESDRPEHCFGCGVFLENDLTSDGAEYVRSAVRADLLSGRTNSIAVTEWLPFYSYIDWDGVCEGAK